jgi:hypothetical protein
MRRMFGSLWWWVVPVLAALPLRGALAQRPVASEASIQVSATVVRPARPDTLAIRTESPASSVPSALTARSAVAGSLQDRWSDRARKVVVIAYVAN